MSEMFEGINANAEQAAAREKAQAEAEAAAMAAWQAEVERRRIRSRRRATWGFVRRVLVAAIVVAALAVAQNQALIDARLVAPLAALSMGWAAVWFGAWLQFMFADGGLLNVSK